MTTLAERVEASAGGERPPIITRLANLAPQRIDHDLVRQVLAIKLASYSDEVRIAPRTITGAGVVVEPERRVG